MPASSAASRALSTASFTVVRSALPGCRTRGGTVLVKNSATEISRCCDAIDSAVARRFDRGGGGGAVAIRARPRPAPRPRRRLRGAGAAPPPTAATRQRPARGRRRRRPPGRAGRAGVTWSSRLSWRPPFPLLRRFVPPSFLELIVFEINACPRSARDYLKSVQDTDGDPACQEWRPTHRADVHRRAKARPLRVVSVEPCGGCPHEPTTAAPTDRAALLGCGLALAPRGGGAEPPPSPLDPKDVPGRFALGCRG